MVFCCSEYVEQFIESFLPVGGCDVRVGGCLGNTTMAQNLFDCQEIRPGYTQPTGGGMAETVEMEILNACCR